MGLGLRPTRPGGASPGPQRSLDQTNGVALLDLSNMACS